MHPDFEVYSIYGKGLVKICLMHILYLCFHGQICLFFIASRNLLHLENAFTNAWMSSCLQSSSTSEIESESLSLICDPPPMAQAGYVKSPWDLKMNLRKPSSMRLKRVSFRIHQSYMINGLFSTPFQIMFEKKGRHSKACGALVPRDLPRMWLKWAWHRSCDHELTKTNEKVLQIPEN